MIVCINFLMNLVHVCVCHNGTIIVSKLVNNYDSYLIQTSQFCHFPHAPEGTL